MKKHNYQERKRNRAFLIVSVSSFFGVMYPILSGESKEIFRLMSGILIGLIGGSFIAFFELYFFNRRNRNIAFIQKLIKKVSVYMLFFPLLIIVTVSLSRSIEYKQSFLSYISEGQLMSFIFNEDFLIILLYTLILTSAIAFVQQISQKMGQNVLWNFIIGRYRVPREEERIFMFLDINHSTTIAEKLGDIKFSNLINDIIFDLSQSILSTYGEIYRYVGDEMVVTWKIKKGLKNANCLRCFFQAKFSIRSNREKYIKTYGFLPSFSAGFHCGKVIVGEIGDVKSQISFFGDILYQTATIEKMCKQVDKDNLVSEALVKRISLPEIYNMKLVSSLKHSQKSIDLYTISEIKIANS